RSGSARTRVPRCLSIVIPANAGILCLGFAHLQATTVVAIPAHAGVQCLGLAHLQATPVVVIPAHAGIQRLPA
ncbi:MAG: hypothetical protein OEV46_02065, partial [Betaproteobacteria bacterium]|nr:hypothetical protein [Betaproteobacteria bacterium]